MTWHCWPWCAFPGGVEGQMGLPGRCVVGRELDIAFILYALQPLDGKRFSLFPLTSSQRNGSSCLSFRVAHRTSGAQVFESVSGTGRPGLRVGLGGETTTRKGPHLTGSLKVKNEESQPGPRANAGAQPLTPDLVLRAVPAKRPWQVRVRKLAVSSSCWASTA